MVHEIQWTDEMVKRIWDYYSTNPAYKQAYFSFHSGKSVLRHVDRYVGLSNVSSLLDFGCGRGYLFEHLSEMKWAGKYYGIDFSEESVKKVNETFSKSAGFEKAVYADGLPSEYQDCIMDMVIAVEVVEHVSDVQLNAIIREIHRVLRPGGYVVITTPNEEDLENEKMICPECGCIFHKWQHVRSWSMESLRGHVESYGFKTIKAEATIFKPESKEHPIVGLVKKIHNSLMRHRPHLLYIGAK